MKLISAGAVNQILLGSLYKLPMVTFILLCAFSSHTFAGTLDDHYLSAFGFQASAQVGSPLQKAILAPPLSSNAIPQCGTPLKHGLRRDWSKLEVSTQNTLAKQLTAPLLSNEVFFDSAGGHFRIHYATSGTDAPPATDANGNIIPDWVETVALTLENVSATYSGLGWRLAPTVAGARYDVYLRDLADQQMYGQTTSSSPTPSPGYTNAYSSFIEVDNDFLDPIFQNVLTGPLTPTEKAIQSLQITAAHEYHHAIQFGYNLFFDIWYAEATSTWYEDELYNGVNQLYVYLPEWIFNSTLPLDIPANVTNGGGYGRWIFHRYLYERYGTAGIKTMWETLATLNSSDGTADIPMVPVLERLLSTPPFSSSLSSDFFGFTKRVYLRDWVTHADEVPLIHNYSPVSALSSFPANMPVTLAHYSFAFYKFTPSFTAPTYLNITISKTSGIRTALFSRIAGVLTEVAANSDGNYTFSGFNFLDPVNDEVVLLIVNATNVDNHMAPFSTAGIIYNVIEPLVPNITAPASSNQTAGGSGGGCFIATAAYGSYLHPQVQILRDFRDKFLLTNAPGRVFVNMYYRLSPPLADFIAQHDLFRGTTRIVLTPLIAAIRHPVLFVIFVLLALALYFITRRRSCA